MLFSNKPKIIFDNFRPISELNRIESKIIFPPHLDTNFRLPRKVKVLRWDFAPGWGGGTHMLRYMGIWGVLTC